MLRNSIIHATQILRIPVSGKEYPGVFTYVKEENNKNLTTKTGFLFFLLRLEYEIQTVHLCMLLYILNICMISDNTNLKGDTNLV